MVRTTISQKHLGTCVFDHESAALAVSAVDSECRRRVGSVGASVVAPVDARGVGVVDDGGAAAVGERVPGPVDERVDPGAGGVEQPGVHAEPGGEGDGAVQLVVVLAHLGDRGTVADHRHDALVVVLERRGLACRRSTARMLSGDRPARLEGDRSELRDTASRRDRHRRSVADGVQPGEALDAEVRADADPAAHVGQCLEPADLARLEPAGPDDAAGQDVACRRRTRPGRLRPR